jgi:hypothetical protein
LGAVLQQMGFITEEELDMALKVQKALRKREPSKAAAMLLEYQLGKAEKAVEKESLQADANLKRATAALEKVA